jgi:integrase
MARTVEHAKIETPTARARLKRGRQPHLQALVIGKAALGYQRKTDATSGRWLLRRGLAGKYTVEALGLADDLGGPPADGETVFSYQQARTKALEVLAERQQGTLSGPLIVRKAFARYVDFLAAQGKRTLETERRAAVWILPELGDLEVSELTSDRIRKWLANIAVSPALLRSKKHAEKRKTKKDPKGDEEAIRRRRSSANRVLTMLKAALNHVYDENLVSNNEAWGRRVKPFRDVDAARTRYLTIEEAKRLLAACERGLQNLVHAALLTGCRYGELCRLQVQDFNRDAGTINVRRSKSGKARHVVLNDEGIAFFTDITKWRGPDDIMLRNEGRIARAAERARPGSNQLLDHGEWRPAEQGRLMREACKIAKIKPAISIHGMRHTWASLAVMAGVPLIVVAKNLGHKDTRMVEKHYGHLAPSFVADAIRAGAPRFGLAA